MKNKRKAPPCQIVFRQDRLVLSRAAAEHLPEFVDLYECGNILAFKGNMEGQMRLSMGSHKYRQNIRAKEALNFVREKYECETGDVLAAWYRDDVLMFCRHITSNEAKIRFNGGFQKIELTARPPEQYSVRIRGFVTSLSGTAGLLFKDRITVYELGEVLAFVPDDYGSLKPELEKDGRTKSVHSRELTDFIRRKYGAEEVTLIGWERDGVLFCSDHRLAQRIPFDKDSFTRHDFPMSGDIVTVNMLQDSRLFISSLGSVVLGDHVNLYGYGDILAFVTDPDGEFKIARSRNRAGCDISCRELVKYVKERFALEDDTERLMPAAVRGNAVYFSKRELCDVPDLSHFERIDFDRICSFHVISVTVTPTGNGRLYVSRYAREHLSGSPLAVYRRGDVWALVPAPDGTLHMSGVGVICSRELALLIQSELQFERTQRFYMRVSDGHVFFCHHRFCNEPLTLETFSLVL